LLQLQRVAREPSLLEKRHPRRKRQQSRRRDRLTNPKRQPPS